MTGERTLRVVLNVRDDEHGFQGAVMNQPIEQVYTEDLTAYLRGAGLDEETSERIARDVMDIAKRIRRLDEVWMSIFIGDE